MAKDRVPPIYTFPSYQEAHEVFQRPIHTPGIQRESIHGLLREVEDWSTASNEHFGDLPDVRVSKRFRLAGDVSGISPEQPCFDRTHVGRSGHIPDTT